MFLAPFFMAVAVGLSALPASAAAPSPVSGFTASASGSSAISLSWQTPQNADLSEFELRESTSPLNAVNFNMAAQVSGVPQPLSGQSQGVTATGLQSNTTYYFGIRVYNMTGEASPIAFASVATQGNGGGGGPACTVPAAVSGLSFSTSSGVAALSWTTPQNANLSEFDVRESASMLNDSTFNIAAQLSGAPQPLAGQVQHMQVSGLQTGTTYYFGVRVYNICGEASSIAYQNSGNTGGGGTGGGGGGGGGGYYRIVIDPSIAINGGAATTATSSVVLTLHGENATQMIISNTQSTAGLNWIPYVTQLPWQLTSGNGNKTVYAVYQSDTGTQSPQVSASIVLATPIVPGNPSILINGGAPTTQTRAVALTLHAENATQMKISNDPNLSGAAWQSYVTQLPWQLTAGDGSKTVYAIYKSADGTTAGPVSASIALATPAVVTPPTPQVLGASATVDFNTLMANWGPVGPGNIADLNHDGKVDNQDVYILMHRWVPITVNTIPYEQ